MKIQSCCRSLFFLVLGFFGLVPIASLMARDVGVHASNEPFFSSRSPKILDLSGGFIVGDGFALPGIDIQLVGRVNTEIPLFAGAELGVFLYTDSQSTAVVVPLLGTAFIEFNASKAFHPVLGLSVGPTLSAGSRFRTARLCFLINPGARFDLGGSAELNTQIRFGAIGSTFVVIPQIGLSFVI